MAAQTQVWVRKDNYIPSFCTKPTVASRSWSCTEGRGGLDQPVPQQMSEGLCCIYLWTTFSRVFYSKQSVASLVLRDLRFIHHLQAGTASY